MKKILFAILLMAPLSIFAQKFAHCNTAEIITNTKEYQAAQTEIENLAKQYDEDLKRMDDEFKKKYEEYQKEAPKLLDNVKQRREAELQDLQNRIQQSLQDNQVALQKAQSEKLQAIQELVLNAIKKVGEAGGYIYIFDGTQLPFVNTSMSTDVTADVKKALGI
ncbi:MAG: OmpH family outer membrane protein [Bacteroidales bacterium]|nr:OmpH family outer membrane protein [Bacteroidales bacterium]